MFAFSLALGFACGDSVRAQVVPSDGLVVGTMAADRARLLNLVGRDSARTPVTPAGWKTRFVGGDLRAIANSDIPSSLNDASMWAGRGFNTSITPAGQLTYRERSLVVRALLAPTVTYSENVAFQFARGRDTTRSAFSSPWHTGSASADLPLRFGDGSIRTFELGQSTVEVVTSGLTGGATTRNEWWGPGIRNTLVMSNAAPGIPRLYIGPAAAVRTAAGLVDARLVIGTLTESRFFDTLSANDYRSFNALLVTLRPLGDTNLTLGLSRAVYAPVRSASAVFGHTFDVLTKWEAIAPPAPSDSDPRQTSDQITSLFARWAFPANGFEVYGEIARMELPRSLREWFSAPQHTQGFIVGAQLVRPLRSHSTYLRIQTEFLDVEQSNVFDNRPPPDFYTGRVAVQGYTQRGQLIGAATGPGSSSQWLAADYFTPLAQIGVFLGRTRTENDALYRLPDPRLTRHDVTIVSGLRGGYRWSVADLEGELTVGRRLNYLFQNDTFSPGEEPLRAIDVQNVTFSLRIVPKPR